MNKYLQEWMLHILTNGILKEFLETTNLSTDFFFLTLH